MRKIPLVTGEIYHVCNRTVEGKKIFVDAKNCLRFLETALIVNDLDSQPPNWKFNSTSTWSVGVKNLVDIYAVVLMPDHFHFLIRQLIDNSIAYFFQRLCNSFGKYFNFKHERKGPLFIGPFKAIRIAFDEQARHIFTYIHSNPLDLIESGWRRGDIKDWQRAEQFIKEYQWSSFKVYSNNNPNPLIQQLINKEFGNIYFNRDEYYLSSIKEWGTNEDFDDLE